MSIEPVTKEKGGIAMKKALWIVSFIPLIITAVVLQFFPDGGKVPMHYDMAGNIDRWGSKYENLIFPVIILGLALVWSLLIGYYERKKDNAKTEKESAEAATNARVMGIVAVACAVLWTALQCVLLYGAYTAAVADATKATVDIGKFSGIFIGVLLIIIANFMTKTRINSTVGIRTVWSMYNENTWRKSNHFGAIVFMITGALIVIGAVFAGSSLGATVISLVLVCVAAVVTVAYSYHVYNEEKKAEALIRKEEER